MERAMVGPSAAVEHGDARSLVFNAWWVRGLALWVAMTVLAPNIAGGLVRPDDALLLILASSVLLPVVPDRKILLPPSLVLTVGLLLALPLLSSLTAVLSGSEMPDRLWREVLRAFKYGTLLIIFSSVKPREIRGVLGALFLATMVAVVVQVVQLWDMFGINQWMASVYGDHTKFISVLATLEAEGIGRRAGSTFINPNIFANYLAVPLLLAGAYFVARRGREHGFTRWDGLLLASFCAAALGIAISESRTALPAVAIGFLVLLTDPNPSNRRGLSTMILVFVAASVMISIFLGLGRVVDFVLVGTGDSSLQIKIALFEEVVQQVFGAEAWRVVVGYGPSHSLSADLEYAYLLHWYGILGIIVYVSIVVSMVYLSLSSRGDVTLRTVLLALTVGMMVFGMMETTLINNRVWPFYLMVATFVYVGDREARSTDPGSAPAG